MLEFGQGVEHGGEERVDVWGAEVAELAVLGPAPDPLVGVILGVVGREVLDDHVGVPGQPGLYRLGLAVDLVAVPYHRPPTRHLAVR